MIPRLLRPFLTRRFIKFAAVGASGVVVNLGFLYLFTRMGVHANAASALAIEGSILSNFLFNHYWTFADRQSSLSTQLVRFHLVSLVGGILQFALFVGLNMLWFILLFPAEVHATYFGPTAYQRWIVDPVFRPPNVHAWVYLSQLAGIGVAMIWNFLANMKWTWADREAAHEKRDAMSETLNTGRGALICIPTYNEAENLPRIVPAVLAAVPDAHVLVVDDNSPDGTGKLADALAASDPRVHVLHRTGKEGLGKAYLAAFAWALARNYEFVFEFDADFSHKPEYLPGFIGQLADGADMVIGSRRVKGGGVTDWGMHRQFISWGGSFYSRTVLGVSVRDLTGGFNGFRRETLQAIGLEKVGSSGYCFQIELKYRVVKAGLNVVELPIVFPDRTHGVSKMSAGIFREALIQVWKLRGLGL